MSLKEDYNYCRNVIKENSKSFYAAFSVLPKEKRNAVYAIYTFCRFADDSIDVLGSLDKLLELEANLDQFVADNTPDTPVFRALRDTFDKYDLDSLPFYDMIEGQKRDYTFIQPATMEEFKDYCYHVAGTVGLLLLPIIATENQNQLKDVAIRLGEAMQITNILRDVGEDYQINRIYLPEDLLLEYPKALQAIETNIVNADFINVWETLAKIAEANYTIFFESIHLFDPDSQKAVANSALFYSEILNVVRKADYDCLTERRYVSSFEALTVKLNQLLKKRED